MHVKELNEAIRIYGRGIGKDIVKVDMFLNHRIDTGLLFRMGEELAAHYAELVESDPSLALYSYREPCADR